MGILRGKQMKSRNKSLIYMEGGLLKNITCCSFVQIVHSVKYGENVTFIHYLLQQQMSHF